VIKDAEVRVYKGAPHGLRSMLKDQVNKAGMRAAHEVNGPRFAHSILTTEELLALLSAARERRAA
jgi:hypothetical protein